MMDDRHVVALIPARGGSTSVPRKNVRALGGKPLVAWSIDVARAVTAIDRTVVSTDDDEIAQVAQEYGAEVADRPDELATDEALVVDAVRYHIAAWREVGTPADVVVLLEPTCPFRSAEDVRACLSRLSAGDVDSVATFTEAALNPHRAWRISDEEGIGEAVDPFVNGAVPWRPRQQLPDAYQLNGGAYAFFADRLPDESVAPFFGRTGAVRMPEERSIDIDTKVDLELARVMVEKLGLSERAN
jgi:N-acylneuraminate cytidylyltransferase